LIQYRLDLLPRRDRLTVFGDKAQIRRGLRPHHAANAANVLIDQGRYGEAATQIAQAKQLFGVSREALAIEVTAYRRLGDSARQSASQAEFDRLIASRLF